MKRPNLALLALLASLAVGLAAVNPRRAEATTLGELFCAIEIVTPPCHAADDDYCTDCPYADDDTEECPPVCTPPSVPAADEVHDSAPVEAPAEADDASATIELNAADSTGEADSESAWEDEYGYYYGDCYSDVEDEYSDEYASQYEAANAEPMVENTTPPVLVEEEAEEVEQATDDADMCYGEGYNPWAPVTNQDASAPSPTDLVVEPSETPAAAVEPYDLYGRQVGDKYYGYDYDETPSSQASDETCEYNYDYDYECANDVEEGDAAAEPADSPASEETAADAQAYYEEYYPDYYAELYGDEVEEEQAATSSDDDLTTEYDATYDEAVYGQQASASDDAAAKAEADLPWADEVAEASDAAESDECEAADRPALESEYGSDYAEEYYRALFGEEEEAVEQSAETVEESETESTPADEESTPADEESTPADEESLDLLFESCDDDHCRAPLAASMTQLVVDCGRQISHWTASLELVSLRLHSACVQLAELPSQIETK